MLSLQVCFTYSSIGRSFRLGFKMFFLYSIEFAQGNISIESYSLVNQGYPPKTSSAHSPDKATVAYFLTSFANKYSYESTSAIPGKSAALVASSKACAKSILFNTIL